MKKFLFTTSGIKIIAALIIFIGFLLVGLKMIDPDLGWHLKVGEWILKNKSAPYFDEYSHTMPGSEWVDHEWLLNGWLYWMYSHNLWLPTVLIFSVLAFIPFLVWIKRSASLIELGLVSVSATLIIGFLGVRPHIFSFFLFFIVLELFYKQKHIWLLPLIFLVWANLHAGFFSGLLAFCIFTAIQLWGHRGHRKSVGHRKSDGLAMSRNPIFLLFFFLLSIAVTFINPYGWKIYREIFKVAVFSDVSKYILEWQPAFSGFNINNPANWLLPVFLGIFGFLAVKFRKNYPLPILTVSLIFLAMFMKSVKIGPLFFLAALPVVTQGARLAKKKIALANLRNPFSKHSVRLIKMIQPLALAGLFLLFSFMLRDYQVMDFPEKAVDFLKEELKKGKRFNIFNDYGWGGYLIWHLPEVKVFIDGRMPHWMDQDRNSAMRDFVKVFYDSKNQYSWQEVFERRKINLVLIKNTEEKPQARKNWLVNYLEVPAREYVERHSNQPIFRKIVNFFRKSSDRNLKETLLKNNWQTVYEDEIAVVLSR